MQCGCKSHLFQLGFVSSTSSSQTIRPQRLTCLLQRLAAPEERETFALRGFDRLDAAGVIGLEEDATSVLAFSQRKSAAIPCQARERLGERVHVHPQKRCDGFRLVGFERDITGHLTACAATSASECRGIDHVTIKSLGLQHARSRRPRLCWPALCAHGSASRRARLGWGDAPSLCPLPG